MLVRVDWEWVVDVPTEGDPEMHVRALLDQLEEVPVGEWPGEVAVARVDPVEPWETERWWEGRP